MRKPRTYSLARVASTALREMKLTCGKRRQMRCASSNVHGADGVGAGPSGLRSAAARDAVAKRRISGDRAEFARLQAAQREILIDGRTWCSVVPA
jgi:hypothetical protein